MTRLAKLAAFPMLLGLFTALCARPALAKKPYSRGVITLMQSSNCGYDASSGMLGAVLGANSTGRTAKVMMCKDYTLRTTTTVYVIRPKDRNADLLPVGVTVLWRVNHDKLKVKLANGKDKKDYYVLSERPADKLQCR